MPLNQLEQELHGRETARLNGGKQEGVRVGKVTVLASPDRQRLHHFTQRLLVHAYQVQETPHFVVCHQPTEHKTILMHTFSQATIDADLICIIEQELAASGLLASAQDYNAVLFAVMASTFPSPRNQQLIWRHFCLTTLARLRVLIAQHPQPLPPPVSHIVPFAAIYQRVMERLVGQSLLDVGSSFGFLPVLLAEHMANVTLVGCDNNPDAISCSTDLAAVTHADQVTFLLRDVLAPDFPTVGHFETVTAIHLLEHVTEEELPIALTHLLRVTSKRLLIAVPYEEKVQPLYGHQQAFTREKLLFWGNWCVENLGGGRSWCEEVMGGLLVVDRSSAEQE